MKKNKILNLKVFIWILFFPFIGSLLSVCGVFIGYIIAYVQIDVFPIETAIPKILRAFKVGGILGLLLGISLWGWGIVIPELTGKFKIDNKDIDDTKNQK